MKLFFNSRSVEVYNLCYRLAFVFAQKRDHFSGFLIKGNINAFFFLLHPEIVISNVTNADHFANLEVYIRRAVDVIETRIQHAKAFYFTPFEKKFSVPHALFCHINSRVGVMVSASKKRMYKNKYYSENNREKIIEKYKKYSLVINKRIKYTKNNKEYYAIVKNINNFGNLEVINDDNTEETLKSGEISIIPIVE